VRNKEKVKKKNMKVEEVEEQKQPKLRRGEHGEGASFLLPEGLGAGRDDPSSNLRLRSYRGGYGLLYIYYFVFYY
jgi:hypothetical protein